jgi:excinuclease ABC subunit C
VNTVSAVLSEMEIYLPVVGIAKSREVSDSFQSTEVKKTEERLIIPGRSNPYILSKCPSLFKIIVSMRDEAHRFSRKLHHKAESKRVVSTWLDEVKGLNGETKKKILSQLSLSQNELKNLSMQELMNYFSLRPPEAKILWKYLNKNEEIPQS